MSDFFDDLEPLEEGSCEVEVEESPVRLLTLAEASNPLTWAHDVLIVYNCLGSALDIKGYVPTAGQRELHRWACDPKNANDFRKNMVPKASESIAKHQDSEQDEHIVRHEKRGVAELQEYLRQAIIDAQEDPLEAINEHKASQSSSFLLPESPDLDEILG